MTAASEQPKQENVLWVVGIHGHEDEFLVSAVTFETYSATAAAATTYRTPGDDFLVTVMRDADGKVVFCAPAASVAYIRRTDVTSRRVCFKDPAPAVHISTAGGDLPGLSAAQVSQITKQVQAQLLQQAKRSRRPGSAA